MKNRFEFKPGDIGFVRHMGQNLVFEAAEKSNSQIIAVKFIVDINKKCEYKYCFVDEETGVKGFVLQVSDVETKRLASSKEINLFKKLWKQKSQSKNTQKK